ncbi:unnamed protein product [Knipowitschia caucasica]
MRLRSGSLDALGLHFLSDPLGGARGVGGRIQRFFRRNSSTNQNTATAPTLTTAAVEEEPEDAQTFEDLLQQQRFSEASDLLIQQETRLYLESPTSQRLLQESPAHQNWELQAAQLQRDHALLHTALLKTICSSLLPDTSSQGSLLPDTSSQALSSALEALQRETQRDTFWMQEQETQRPAWRPSGLQEAHDQELRALVEERMDRCSSVQEEVGGSIQEEVGGSSIQQEVWWMGRRLREDLERVVRQVEGCYHGDAHICNMLMQMYHGAMATHINNITQYGLDDRDCSFLLRWVHDYYPQMLLSSSWSEHIDTEALEKLLDPSLLQPLEEQYLSREKEDLQTYISKVLNEAKQLWIDGETPPREDGRYTSDTAFHIIQIVKGKVTTAETVLSDRSKAQSLTTVLPELLYSYRRFVEDVMKSSKRNTATIKANLHCTQQFIDVLQTRPLFPADVRAQCLVSLREILLSQQQYLLSHLDTQLNPLYKKLSSDWLRGETFKKILETIESQRSELQEVHTSSLQELVGLLHIQVAVQYVKMLLRGNKLKDKGRQEEAQEVMRRDARRLQEVLCALGSPHQWITDVLFRFAELLKLQDVAAVQMHVVSMVTAYPDLRESHVYFVLKLKSNFSKTNRQKVIETLQDTLSESAHTTETHTTETHTTVADTAAATERMQLFFTLLSV